MAQVSETIKRQVRSKLRECIAKAESHYHQKFAMPTILYKKRGTTAGEADVRAWTVNFNTGLLLENVDDFLARTVPHEMAHLVDYQVNPSNFRSDVQITLSGRIRRSKRSVHGPSWKAIMILFGAPTSRCHSYDTTNTKINKRKQAKHVYVCKCGAEMKLGAIRHGRHQQALAVGRGGYSLRGHRGCGGYTYKGLEGSVSPTIAPRALPKAANAAKPKKVRTGMSKLDTCRALYNASSVYAGRKEVIALFIKEGNCTPAGASSYYQKIKKEQS